MEFQIIRAGENDGREMAQISRKAYEAMEHKEWFVMDGEEYISRMLQKENGAGYKAIEKNGGKTAAIVLVTYPGNSPESLGHDCGLTDEEMLCAAHMDIAAVLPEFQGNRLQKKMMKTAEEDLIKKDFHYVMGTVHPDNIYSRNNFIRSGYEYVKTAEKYGGFTRDIFIKKLI